MLISTKQQRLRNLKLGVEGRAAPPQLRAAGELVNERRGAPRGGKFFLVLPITEIASCLGYQG